MGSYLPRLRYLVVEFGLTGGNGGAVVVGGIAALARVMARVIALVRSGAGGGVGHRIEGLPDCPILEAIHFQFFLLLAVLVICARVRRAGTS